MKYNVGNKDYGMIILPIRKGQRWIAVIFCNHLTEPYYIRLSSSIKTKEQFESWAFGFANGEQFELVF